MEVLVRESSVESYEVVVIVVIFLSFFEQVLQQVRAKELLHRQEDSNGGNRYRYRRSCRNRKGKPTNP